MGAYEGGREGGRGREQQGHRESYVKKKVSEGGARIYADGSSLEPTGLRSRRLGYAPFFPSAGGDVGCVSVCYDACVIYIVFSMYNGDGFGIAIANATTFTVR